MPNPNDSTGTVVEPVEAPETGTPGDDEVTLLRSRTKGLDAKVTALQASEKAALERAAAAEARALELAQAKEGGDAELRAELEKAKQALSASEQKALLGDIKATYPETFGVLGDAALKMTADQLAAAEARFAGVAAGELETPNPVGANPPRGAAPSTKAIEDMDVKELRAHLRKFDISAMLGTD